MGIFAYKEPNHIMIVNNTEVFKSYSSTTSWSVGVKLPLGDQSVLSYH